MVGVSSGRIGVNFWRIFAQYTTPTAQLKTTHCKPVDYLTNGCNVRSLLFTLKTGVISKVGHPFLSRKSYRNRGTAYPLPLLSKSK